MFYNLPLFSHQETMAEFGLANSRVLNISDPGTGKTRGTLEAFNRRRRAELSTRLLVIAPLTILKSAWADDIVRFFPDLRYEIAHGSVKNRTEAFKSSSHVVIMNHDGVRWLHKHMDLLEGFSDLIIDEFTAFKNRSSQRSTAMLKISKNFEHITELSGTANPNTILDIWHPAYILDGGDRLGKRFFQFRNQVCQPEQIGPLPEHVKWVDKPGAEEAVADALSDVTIRFKLEDCQDIPPNTTRVMYVDMPDEVMQAYNEMEQESELILDKGYIDAVHAGVKVKKMLQILSGSIYDSDGKAHFIHNDRYALVMQLVDERAHSIVAFNWSHEKEELIKEAIKRNISYAVIDGSVRASDRPQIVEDFQKGKIKVLFCHPQSAGHGLTLTRGTTTIWCTPTYNAEHFQQFNRRIYRAGQTQATMTICIAARNTKEEDVYDKLNGKLTRMEDLLTLFAQNTEMLA